MDDDLETYLLLLLADSNLPTGSFVASAGLESYLIHGHASTSPPHHATLNFLRDSLATYARSALPFVSDAHRVLDHFATHDNAAGEADGSKDRLEHAISTLIQLDELYDNMTLNHVARRASKSQGVALLTLYSRGFSRPPFLASFSYPQSRHQSPGLAALIDRLKSLVRAENTHGHLPICWGALTGALGLTLERSQYLHLFLHARSLLSASVRLNEIGPYGSQQVLLHAVRPLIAAETSQCQHLCTGVLDQDDKNNTFDDTTDGPANTWPLGEILAARHDLQHSRIFNS